MFGKNKNVRKSIQPSKTSISTPLHTKKYRTHGCFEEREKGKKMADTATIQFLLDNLGQLVKYHYDLISDAANQVEQLTDDLHYFNAFLKYASSRTITDATERNFVKKVRDAVYDAEDILDAFVTQTLSTKSKSWFKKLFIDTVKIDGIAQKLQSVQIEVTKACGDKSQLLNKIGVDITEKLEISPVREKNVVGLEDTAKEIIGLLNEDTPRLDIISIVGMPGLGKSTLAGKVYRDPAIQYEFPTRLWVYVSKFPPTDVFLSILKEFTSITEEMRNMSELDLAAKVRGHLERGKFLIVMDDVWTVDDWKKIDRAMPTSNNLGKILITSRYANVAISANSLREPHKMRTLYSWESVQLLQYEVFGEPKWEPEFEIHGNIVAEKCKGLPLAIVVIGGIIVKKLSATQEPIAKVKAWKDFSEKVNEYISDDLTMDRVISLSYETLPYHLKACFLYFGMFPEDIEIPTWKLFRMWIAEGFVQGKKAFSLEAIAESYLDELITRNLVRVQETSSDGKAKTCRIHDSLREFCKKRAGKEDESFFEEVVKSSDGPLTPAVSNDKSSRRLCIHSNISMFVSSKPSGSRVRSFLCYSKEDITLVDAHVSAIPGGYKLLRVLDVKPIKFTKVPSDMYELLHLRYIHLSCNLKILPQAFCKLWNMQTIIVDTTERILTIKADIWKMRHLRHLKTNATAMLPEPKLDAEGENNIQTLGSISPENCTDKVLSKARNMKRVSIRGELESLVTGAIPGASFSYMTRLKELEKLKMQNDVFPKSASEVPLSQLPPSEKFPPKLRILTLSNTSLDWNQMKVLGSLYNLEVLKLKENAFTGNYWVADYNGFSNLQVLFIGRTDLSIWKMSSVGIFPKLMHLELQNCDKLREIPIEFAQISSLDVLTLNHSPSAATSAQKIQKIKIAMLEAKGLKATEFKLSIFPPVNEIST